MRYTYTCPNCSTVFSDSQANRKYCSEPCRDHASRLGKPEDVWRRIDKSRGAQSCWPWLGAVNANGYGILTWHANPLLAHRLAYEFTYGGIDSGLFVCHHCDNPRCCNPAHLFVGTHNDNMSDKVKKGRQAHNTGQSGEDHHDAILTYRKVKEIRTRYSPRKVTLRQLADEYGITYQTVWDVIHHRTWKS